MWQEGNFIFKDSGHGVTEESLKFWNENRNKIGEVSLVEVAKEGVLREDRTEDGLRIPIEYNLIAFGSNGVILLSGCNCGYGGTGPNGTAKILTELGLPPDTARHAMYSSSILFDLSNGELILDEGKFYFPLAEWRRFALAHPEMSELINKEINRERGREVMEEMKKALQGDDGEGC